MQFEEQGYRRVHEGRHILRNKEADEIKKKELIAAVCMFFKFLIFVI